MDTTVHIKTDAAVFVIDGGRCREVRDAQGHVLASIQADLSGARFDGLIPLEFLDHPEYQPRQIAILMERSGKEEDPSESSQHVTVYLWKEGEYEWMIQFTIPSSSRKRVFGGVREILAPPQTTRTTLDDTPVARHLTPASGVQAFVPDPDSEEADVS